MTKSGKRVIAELQAKIQALETRLCDRQTQIDQLTANVAKFRAIAEHACDTICTLNAAGELTYLSPNVQDSIGYTPAELMGQPFAPLVHPDDLPRCDQVLRQVITTAHPHPAVEYRVRHKQGHYVWHQASLAAYRDESGNVMIIAIGRDATHQKQTEAALAKSQAQLEAILQNANVAIFAKDLEGRYIFANSWVSHEVGLSVQEILGKTDADFLPPAVVEQLQRNDRLALETGQPLRTEELIASPDGDHAYLAIKFPLLDRDGTPYGVCGISTNITDLKRTEAALRTSEARLSRILDRTLACIADYRVYRDRRFVAEFFSSGSLQLWGFTPEELLDDLQLYMSRYEPEDLKTIINQSFDYIFNEQPYRYEYRYHHPDGSLRWIELNLNSYRDNEEDYWRTTVISIDITDRKRSEEALRESETKLNRILDRITACIADFRVYPDRRFVGDYFSSGSVQLWGFTPEDLLTDLQPWTSRYHPDDLATTLAEAFNYIFKEQPYTNEYRYYHPDGSLRWIQLNLTAYWDESEGCWRTPTVSIDITDRKRAEIALARSEAQFRRIVENASDLIMTTTPAGIITYVSPIITERLGYTPDELIGQNFAPLVHPDDMPLVQHFVEHLLTTGQGGEFEHRDVHRDGSVRYVVVNVSQYEDENGNLMLLAVIKDITDRKRLEENLRQSELKFRRIVENANDIIATVSTEGILTYITPNYGRIFGRNSEDVIGKLFEPLVHPEDIPRCYACIQQAIATQETQTLEYRLLHARGGYRHVVALISLVYDDQNSPLILGISRDVTEQKQLEEQLRQSEYKFRAIVENANDLIYVIDATGQIIYMSPNSTVIYGLSPEEMQGIPFDRFIHPDDFALAVEAIQRSIAGEQFSFEVRLFHKDGSIRWFGSNISPYRMPNGEIGIMGIGRDTTDRKRLEEDLRQSQQFLNSVIENIPMGFFAKDVRNDFRYVLINRCGENFVGFSGEVGIGHNDFELLPPAQAAFYRQQDEAVVHRRSLIETPELELVSAMGDRLLARILKFPLFDDQGILTHVLCLTDDITERKQREEELHLAKDAAEAANRAKSTFLANMSHELRTPLNVILGFTQLMERDTSLSDRQRQYITTINRSGEHLLNLINDVLEMSKIEAGRITLHPESFDLGYLLDTLQDMFRVRAEAKHICLEFVQLSHLPPAIIADAGKLRQVLINLLSNAVKFTEQGQITLQVEMDTEQQQTHDTPCTLTALLRFRIADTGIGISPHEIEQLFQPFVQTASGLQVKEGTGLGLTISRQFVHLMGGEITVESVLGQGSTFCFQIPVTLAIAPHSPVLPRPQSVLGLAPDQPTYRLLIVDDRLDNRTLLTHLLQPLGFETQTASNGQEAIAGWQTWQPHLIWMDMRMPILDGYEATRQIRDLEASQRATNCPTKIIALTASAFEEQRATVLAAGCDDFVRKPFREQVIFDKLTEHLGVQFLYDHPPDVSALDVATALQPSALQVMPAAWLQDLQQATIAIDSDRLLQLVAEIPAEQSALAQALVNLIERFEFDALLDLIGGSDRHV